MVQLDNLEQLDNGTCYSRVIKLAKDIRKKLDRIKKQKSVLLVSPPPKYPLPPLPKPSMLPIQHVKKKANGLKGFLTKTYRLGPILLTNQLVSKKNTCFYFGRLQNKPIEVLKLYITTTLMHDHLTSRFGFTFSCQRISRRQKTKDGKTLSSIADSRIQSALLVWFSTVDLPPIQCASHLLCNGFKLYVVY
ncbi:hypothetical protein G6F37_004168 [Rhizopus arrhizus]|nr:hypothetical protein G6F38_009325 [Rhizopus arrhizus]KAG1160247.1 hypothetical protein G6F37_004168 [Rhizopus arrhizus]